ncbi:hypothetical protein M0811_03552 [Anaeramoeba ignava]|uniref:Uncharacterized protein n=1 Tax=Anaeramoeba ignava TaxID=1746090 RepID=A0A9Q0R424_ANAIG|nr:hypothetical protein M0811_03552 [Anaeramoeba ignava]
MCRARKIPFGENENQNYYFEENSKSIKTKNLLKKRNIKSNLKLKPKPKLKAKSKSPADPTKKTFQNINQPISKISMKTKSPKNQNLNLNQNQIKNENEDENNKMKIDQSKKEKENLKNKLKKLTKSNQKRKIKNPPENSLFEQKTQSFQTNQNNFEFELETPKRPKLDRSYSFSGNNFKTFFPNQMQQYPTYQEPFIFYMQDQNNFNQQNSFIDPRYQFPNNFANTFTKSKSESNLHQNTFREDYSGLSFLSEMAANYLNYYEEKSKEIDPFENQKSNSQNFSEKFSPSSPQLSFHLVDNPHQQTSPFAQFSNTFSNINPFDHYPNNQMQNTQFYPFSKNIENGNQIVRPKAVYQKETQQNNSFLPKTTITKEEIASLQVGDCVGMRTHGGYEIFATIKSIINQGSDFPMFCSVKWLIPNNGNEFGIISQNGNIHQFKNPFVNDFLIGQDEPIPQPLTCITRKLDFRFEPNWIPNNQLKVN